MTGILRVLLGIMGSATLLGGLLVLASVVTARSGRKWVGYALSGSIIACALGLFVGAALL